ncbi:hypothetical protein NQ318_000502 [Aromia moschata]|uniref:Fork-head domain-containing protein n=1 Tax=Aromia moschata TaxID=1265417 RepID=A0AAV8YEP9_9CUCU|nr:hypothetical protein NQ318_000502 [Aromia moschata]
MAPERPVSPHEEIVMTPKMSVPGSPVAGTPIRDAQSPMSILLAVAQSHNRNPDDDLTSLNWLHERDLLKALKHPHNIPYDPLVHTNNKPPYSFSCLIFMAIEDSVQKALPVKEIYAWILDHFPYFKNAPTGWKNSVRHNLSLNKCFQKVEKAPNLGKGSLWTVDPQYKPNLIQALNRSPFHPCSTLDPSSYYSNRPQPVIPDKSSSYRLPNPDLFPFLSRKLASTEMNNQEESLEAVDAAAVMLSLKNGPRVNHKKEKVSWQVITTSPSQDHTYSAADSAESVNGDEAFESDEDRTLKSHTCRKIDFEDDEERRIKEGAETLLNLAGINMRKRHNSQSNEFYKKLKLLPQYDINKNESEEKPAPFKPRLLRTKKKESSQKSVINNNNDEWVKHRRELEKNQNR